MTGLVTLDIAIGLVFTLLIFALFATAIQEALASLLRWRAAALKLAVRSLLGKEFDKFWNQPLIDALKGQKLTFTMPSVAADDSAVGKTGPSYLQPEIFAKAVLTLLGLENKTPAEVAADLKARIDAGTASAIEERIYGAISGVAGSAADAEKAVSDWFDETMKRVTGWYVRRTQFVLFFIGLAMAVVTNTDLVSYAKELARNDGLREQVVLKAQEIAALEDLDDVRRNLGIPADAADGEAPKFAEVTAVMRQRLDTLTRELQGIEAQSGWSHCPALLNDKGDVEVAGGTFSFTCMLATIGLDGERARGVENPLLGWLLLAFGVMLGAQFWFDLLKRFVSLRSAVTGTLGGGARPQSDPST